MSIYDSNEQAIGVRLVALKTTNHTQPPEARLYLLLHTLITKNRIAGITKTSMIQMIMRIILLLSVSHVICPVIEIGIYKTVDTVKIIEVNINTR